MKKLLIILTIAWIVFPGIISATPSPAPPEDLRPVILIEVSKSNGGIFSIFNLYRDVQFTVDEILTDMVTAKLRCYGAGYSVCKAPNNVVTSYGPGNSIEQFLYSDQCIRTVNALIEISETAWKKGEYAGTASKKISTVVNGTSQLYFYTATWKYDRNADGTVLIKVYKNPLVFSSRM
jgi:hypothetical protein